MDLHFNRIDFNPSADFGDKNKKIGTLSKYEIKLCFKKKNVWDDPTYIFLFDTGANISFAPISIIKDFGIKPVFDGCVHGISTKPECTISVHFTQLSFKIIDDNKNESSELSCWFALHEFDGPFLFGMKGLIEDLGFNQEISLNELTLSCVD